MTAVLPADLAAVTPCIHYTMGGLSISSSAEVLRQREKDGVLASVLGLFAAGEVIAPKNRRYIAGYLCKTEGIVLGGTCLIMKMGMRSDHRQ